MRFGITILTDQPWAQARDQWRGAEELGFDHAWTYDHLIWGGLAGHPWRGALPTLAAAAAVTERIGLGTLVSTPNFRHPYLLLRDAQAVDDVAGGRLLLGLGAGGDIDSRVLGDPDRTAGARVERFFAFADLLDRLRREDQVTVEGEWYVVREARTLPHLPHVPLVLAGNGPRSVRHAARHGDGWVTTGEWGVPLERWWDGLARLAGVLDEERGDSSADFARYLLIDSVTVGGEPGRVSLRSAAFFEELVGRAAHLRFTDVVGHWPRAAEPFRADLAVLHEVATDVMPRWR